MNLKKPIGQINFPKMESSQQKYPPNPRDSTNIFSILFFSWTIPLFKKGYGKILELEDMFRPLKSDHSNLLGDRLERYGFLLQSYNTKLTLKYNKSEDPSRRYGNWIKVNTTEFNHKSFSKAIALFKIRYCSPPLNWLYKLTLRTYINNSNPVAMLLLLLKTR